MTGLTSVGKLFASVGLPVEDELELELPAGALIDRQPADVDLFRAPGLRFRALGPTRLGRVEQVPGPVAASVDELGADALPGVEGPLLGEGRARDEVRVHRRQEADVGAERVGSHLRHLKELLMGQ